MELPGKVLILTVATLVILSSDISSVSAATHRSHSHDTVNSTSASNPGSASHLNLKELRLTMKKLEHLQTFNESDLTDDLATWEAPRLIQEKFPYYLSGYDDEGKPIWIIELGKMDLRSVVEQGDEMVEAVEKSFKQLAYRIQLSLRNNSMEPNGTDALFLVDCEGLEMRQLTYMPNLVTIVKMAYQYRNMVIKYMYASILINANFLTETVFRIVKPAFGPAVARIDVYGTKRRKWLPAVRRLFGSTQIPEVYGGISKDFKPIAFYG